MKEEVEFFKERANRASDATRYASKLRVLTPQPHCFAPLVENMQLKHELATLKWSLDVNHSKSKFDDQIMELRGKLLEVNEVKILFLCLDLRSFSLLGNQAISRA